MLKIFSKSYHDIISVSNLLLAWREFVCGKRNKKDVQEFAIHLADNILDLHNDLKSDRYLHGEYYSFNISDPKPRNIHKATIRDRVLHHAIYRVMYPYFDTKFLRDSYSCRVMKGTHRATKQLKRFYYKSSRNNTKTVWALKCDVKKFFASIDHKILFMILGKYIRDSLIINLLQKIVDSFSTSNTPCVGLPLGNLTSQLLVNIYLHELDFFIKHELRLKYYTRYADDFLIICNNREDCLATLKQISNFLNRNLKLKLHRNKVHIKTFSSGVDFLGWVYFYTHSVLRKKTADRIEKKMKKEEVSEQAVISYRGLLSHGNTWKLRNKLKL